MKIKHLFSVHSNITLVLAFSIIDFLKIDKKDVIFLVKRISIDENWGVNSIYIDEYTKIRYVDNKLARLYKITKIDSLIKVIVSPYFKFNLYLSHFNDPLSQIIGSHRFCNQINFIEEGFMAFRDISFLKKQNIELNSKWKLFLFKLGWFFRVADLAYFPKSNKNNYFVISEGAFKSFKNRILIPVFQPAFIESIKLKDHATIVIIDAVVEHSLVSVSYFQEKINLLVKWLHENAISEVYLKWHPAQSDNIKLITLNTLNTNHIIVNQIMNDVILEYVFKNTKDLKIVGFSSSLLIYGVINKQCVYSFVSPNMEFDELRNKIGELPEIWNQIKLIA